MIEDILIFLLRLVLDIFFVTTGELILYLLSLGKHKPRFDLYTKSASWKFVFFSELSGIVGMTFWIIFLIILIKVVKRTM